MPSVKPPKPGVHRLVRFIYETIILEHRTFGDVAKEAGVHHNMLRLIFDGNDISLTSLEAILNSLGYTIKPTPLVEPDQPDKKRGAKAKGVVV